MSKQNIPEWYKIAKCHCFDCKYLSDNVYIFTDVITNSMLHKLKIPIEFTTKNVFCLNHTPNPDLNIDKLIEKLPITGKLIISMDDSDITINYLPNTIKHLVSEGPTIFTNIPKSVETFEIVCEKKEIDIPKLPEGIKNVIIVTKQLNDTFFSLPSSIENLKIEVDNLGINIDIWPINLKSLHLNIKFKCNSSISMLPTNLEKIRLFVEEYKYFLDLPPCLKYLEIRGYKPYTYSFQNNLPHTLETLYITYTFYPNLDQFSIDDIPRNCKTITYFGCSKDLLKKIQNKFKSTNIVFTMY